MHACRPAIVLSVLTLVVIFGSTALAAPPDARIPAAPIPLTVTPETVRPGQTIRVTASGLGGFAAGTSACLGVLGPGRNVELNRSPAFRPRIGTIVIGANGAGQADVRVPSDLVGGTYRVILGGCSPLGNIAPLTVIAEGTLTVVMAPAGTSPQHLPSTGGVPLVGAGLLGLIGLSAAFLKFACRGADRRGRDY